MSKGFHTGRAMMGKDDIDELILRRRREKKIHEFRTGGSRGMKELWRRFWGGGNDSSMIILVILIKVIELDVPLAIGIGGLCT